MINIEEEIQKLAMKCKVMGTERNDTLELLDETFTFRKFDLHNIRNNSYYKGNMYLEDVYVNGANIELIKNAKLLDRQAIVTWKAALKDAPSCISHIHAIWDTKEDMARFNVYIRSSNAHKKLLSDIVFLRNLIENEIENKGDYILDIKFGTVHIYTEDVVLRNDPKTIFFDGLDKTGKTAVQSLLFKMRDKIDFIGDRFLVSPVAFNSIYKRKHVQDNINDYLKPMFNFGANGALYFYFTAKPEVVYARCVEHNETQLSSLEEVKRQLKIFDDVVHVARQTGIILKTIDTTKTTPFDAAWECYKYLL